MKYIYIFRSLTNLCSLKFLLKLYKENYLASQEELTVPILMDISLKKKKNYVDSFQLRFLQ